MDAIIAIDQYVLESLYAMRELLVSQIFIWVTELGSTVIVGGLALCVALGFALRGRIAYLAGLIISVAGSAGVVFLLKDLLQRARPDQTFQAYLETGFSFPSGHATLSLAFYGFLAWLVWHASPSKKWRVVSLLGAVLLVGAIGFSRLYLGVHFASDVLAGFAVAGLFVWAGIVITRKFEQRRSSPNESR